VSEAGGLLPAGGGVAGRRRLGHDAAHQRNVPAPPRHAAGLTVAPIGSGLRLFGLTTALWR
jgi:hypothetical protein